MKKIFTIFIPTATLLFSVAATAATYQTDTFLSKIDSGMGKVATEAYVDEPMGFTQNNGDVYFVDTANNAVEKIDGRTQKLTRIAGTSEYGYVDGEAKNAQFASPYDLAVRGKVAKTIYVADTANHKIRKISQGNVSTWLSNLREPKGVDIYGQTLFIGDTGNNRILAANTESAAAITLADSADGLNLPTKLQYCPAVDKLIFVNFGEGAVRALDTSTGKISDPLIKDLEDIGGVYCVGRTLFVASSYSIGVFNEIWKIRLNEKGTDAVSKKRISNVRETEHLNWPADIILRQDNLRWEEYYTWEPNLLYVVETPQFEAADNDKEENAAKVNRSAKKRHPKYSRAVRAVKRRTKSELQCLKIRKQGEPNWRTEWFTDIDSKSEWQTANFILRKEYQGDLPYFRVKLVYDNKELDSEERLNLRNTYQSDWIKGRLIASVDSSIGVPTNLGVTHQSARQVTLTWGNVSGATKYQAQLFEGETRIFTAKNATTTQTAIKKNYLKANSAYSFRVSACVNNNCGEWSELYDFRTMPSKIDEIRGIRPARASNITQLENGDFLVTLRYRLPENKKRYPRQNLSGQVQLCSKNLDHSKKIEVPRLYVLYKGGSSILTWRLSGKLPQHYAGKHRFQDDYGKIQRALVGRPKALAFSPDGSKMYISQNNQFATYNFTTKKLTHLAGHLMDSYVEGTGREVRISDVTDMVISSNGKWIYFVDRNNHRIRKINTNTGTTKYITGAGGTNFSFGSIEGNGYQEGGPCEDVFEAGKKGCAYFNRPTGIALSPDDKTLYVAEGSNNRIRAVDVDSGETRLVAGNGTAGFVDGTGEAAQFNGPYSLDVTIDGATLYVADKYNHAVRKIDLATKKVTTVFGKGTMGFRDGSFSDAVLAIPEYLREENGVIYWTEAGSHTLRAASLSSQKVYTVSGNGKKGFMNGEGKNAEWSNPKGFAFRGGKVYVADYANDLIRTVEL